VALSGLAITDECSLAGIVRAHVQAKEENLPLVIGSYFRLVHADKSPAFGLILLAQNRKGYGNLSELITLGRMRAPKGSYLLTPQDIARPEKDYAHLRAMPDCLAILVPDFPAKPEALSSQLEWMNATFPARAWVGLTLHQRAMDDIHRGIVEHVAARHLIPVVATGNVVMHVRSVTYWSWGSTPIGLCGSTRDRLARLRRKSSAPNSSRHYAASMPSPYSMRTHRTR